MIKNYFLLFVLSSTIFCFSQADTVYIKFNSVFGKSKLESNKKYFGSAANDSISVELFKFYISKISFLKDGKIVYEQNESFHLVDIDNKTQIPVYLNSNVDFNEVEFCIGIDSLTNVSGAMGGDLDPVNGMYWAWQSGYINFKLEGKSKKCTTRNNLFQFHVGGYLPPNGTLQTISLSVMNKSSIEIIVDIEKFLNQIDLTAMNTIMSPGEKAVKLASLYMTIFSIKE